MNEGSHFEFVPIHCFSCNMVLANRFETYKDLVNNKGMSPDRAMTRLKVLGECCRRMFRNPLRIPHSDPSVPEGHITRYNTRSEMVDVYMNNIQSEIDKSISILSTVDFSLQPASEIQIAEQNVSGQKVFLSSGVVDPELIKLSQVATGDFGLNDKKFMLTEIEGDTKSSRFQYGEFPEDRIQDEIPEGAMKEGKMEIDIEAELDRLGLGEGKMIDPGLMEVNVESPFKTPVNIIIPQKGRGIRAI